LNCFITKQGKQEMPETLAKHRWTVRCAWQPAFRRASPWHPESGWNMSRGEQLSWRI